MDDASDAELIQRSLSDPAAFEAVFDRHFDIVRRYAQARVGIDAGEDIAADTFVIAFRRRSSFDARYVSARPWLLGIASNLIRRHARTEHARMRALARIVVEEASYDPVRIEALDAQRIGPLLLEALGDLDPAQRDTFLLFSVGELTYEEVAAAQGIPTGTVRSRIFNVRRLLRERLELFEAITGWRDD